VHEDEVRVFVADPTDLAVGLLHNAVVELVVAWGEGRDTSNRTRDCKGREAKENITPPVEFVLPGRKR